MRHKKLEKQKRRVVICDDRTWNKVKDYAYSHNLSASEFVRTLINDFFKNLEKK
jgi:hypothetical protein